MHMSTRKSPRYAASSAATGRRQSENRNINGFILRDGNGKLQFGLEKGAEYNRELELSGQSGILESRRRCIIYLPSL